MIPSKAGGGPQAFLDYRDCGLTAATGGRVQAGIARTNGPCHADTGWQYHKLDIQFAYILAGRVVAKLEGLGEFRMAAGDAIVIPSGHNHDFTGFSEDFEVLEINVPAEFETVAM